MVWMDMNQDELSQLSTASISEWFWDVIGNAEQSRDRLAHILRDCAKAEVRQFIKDFKIAVYLLTDEPYVSQMGSISEDGMLDICGWVVSQGKAFYLDVIIDPKKTPKHDEIDTKSNLAWVAEGIYWECYGEEYWEGD